MKEFLNKYKNHIFTMFIVGSMGWMTTIFNIEKGLHEWYENKQNSKALGPRLDVESGEFTCVARDGKKHHAYYVDSLDCFVYSYKGKQFKCP